MTSEENSLIAGDLNVGEMDDDELRRLLQENEVDVGPIVDSTRPFYKKKLALILRGENGVVNGSNRDFSDTEPETDPEEDDQPSGVTSPQEKRPSTRSHVSSSSSTKKSPGKSSTVTSGLRKRLNLTEELESSSFRSTPTPRRSIHSYKVTETTRQTIVREHDGTERRDTTHVLERSENKGDDELDAVAAKSTFLSARRLIVALLLLAVLASVLYYLNNQKEGPMSVESIMKSIEQSVKGNPAVEAPPSTSEQKTAPPPRDLPPQGAVADL